MDKLTFPKYVFSEWNLYFETAKTCFLNCVKLFSQKWVKSVISNMWNYYFTNIRIMCFWNTWTQWNMCSEISEIGLFVISASVFSKEWNVPFQISEILILKWVKLYSFELSETAKLKLVQMYPWLILFWRSSRYQL